MNTIKTNSIVKALNLPQISQIGIVVNDMNKALSLYTGLLGIKPWYRAKIVKSEITFKGNKIDQELDIVVGYSGSVQFELIQVIKGNENIYSDLINKEGHGLHHIGFLVSNIEKQSGVIEQHGFQSLQHGSLTTKGKAITRFNYFDTFDECGYFIELIQTTLHGINVGMSRYMMKLGKLFGDVEVIA